MDDDVPYCANSDGRPAIGEQTVGLTSTGTEVVELLCGQCLGAA